ncbi:hypothetical protein HHL11_11285 [Ramlibacter sp. G-1-2-2]|uniref:Uncharacterized protein n=1 Tax=Ramlibacter agri TaxID=2728837 RepID=A0A848H1I3_9BURK|nr:hypothetical protein [Ramlibacter agri]NML44337.1 hypothetical protein [Ramlibacter agri]
MPETANNAHPKSRLSSTILPGVGVLVVVFLAAMMWLTDFITLQGERTIYTVTCEGGQWEGARCTGRLAAGPRFRFRALRVHEEVLFWTAGNREASGKFSNCQIHDGRNWTCPASATAAGTITLQMEHGRAIHDATGKALPFKAVEKWRWLLLRTGLWAGSNADY